MTLHNLSAEPCTVSVAFNEKESAQLTDLFGNKVYEPTSGAIRVIALDGYGYRWFRIDGLRH